MKAVSFAIIVYVVFMLTQPCQDIAVFADSCNGEAQSYTHIDPQQERQEASDICSPLCICSCCSTSVANHYAFRSFSPDRSDSVVSSVSISYETPYSAAFLNSIWQPPKA
ncbi:MAG: hypothetical protein HOP17_07625 [Acidobacteria bacterium]|nr:hypothetical protein [Acidobacteriota bacterium]